MKTALKTIISLVSLTLLSLNLVHAQAPQPQPTIQPTIQANIPAPGAQPGNAFIPNQQKAAFDPNAVIPGNIEQPTMPGEIVAQFYREWTNKRVIVSKAALAVEISFNQPGPLTYAQAASLLEKTALLDGLVFVPSGPNEVKLVLAQSGRNTGGTRVITNEFELPNTKEELVTYVMKLDHIKAEEALQVLNSVISSLTPKGSVAAVPNANAIIITEGSALIRSLIEIKERIDIPQELAKKEMITLEHADAEEISTKVQEIMDFQAEQGTRIASASGGGRATPNNLAIPLPGGGNANPNGNNNNRNNTNRNNNNARTISTVRLTPEARTNRILVMGRPIDVEFATSLIRDFDAPNSARTYYRKKLSYLAVTDFIPIAQNAIELATTKTSDSAQGAGGAAGAGNRNNNTNRNTNNNQNTGANGNGATGLSESSRSDIPESVIIGKTLIVGDNANNTVIVQGPPQSIKVVDDLVLEMDVPTEQIQITAIFGRYTLSDDLNFGVDFARLFNSPRGDSGFAFGNQSSNAALTDPAALNAFNQFAGPAGFSIYGRIGSQFAATINALESLENFKVISRPTVFTKNNNLAILSSGQSIAVPSNSFTSGATGGQSTNITFRDVLLQLEVIPLVNNDNEVSLEISLTNDSLGSTTIIDDNEIRDINREEIRTTVTVPNGETIILGGLITEEDNDTSSGIPVLSKIPGLGRLFSTSGIETIENELVIFIQPRIVKDMDDLKRLQVENEAHSDLIRTVREDERTRANQQSEKYQQPVEEDTTTTKSNKRRSPLDYRFRGRRR